MKKYNREKNVYLTNLNFKSYTGIHESIYPVKFIYMCNNVYYVLPVASGKYYMLT
jgi:hypothetical protein